MAYAAVISLKQTIHRFLNDSPQILTQEMLKSAYEEISSLQKILQGLQIRITDSSISKSRISSSQTAMNALNGEIRDAANKLEDAVDESHVSQSGYDDLVQEVHSFKGRVKKMEDEYNCIVQDLESSNPLAEEEEEEDDDVVVDFGGKKSNINNMVGLSDVFSKIKDDLNPREWKWAARIITILGMAGIGKTTLAWKIFKDPYVQNLFPHHAFVKVGPKYQLKEITLAILDQVSHGTCKVRVNKLEVVQTTLVDYLYEKGYLIVLDDVWDKKILESLTPCINTDIEDRILVTTRVKEVAQYATYMYTRVHKMRFLNKQESLYLLRGNVFGRHDQSFPDEKSAEKIVENCEGLPLAIIAVAELLSKGEKNKPEYWKKMAQKGNSIFLEVGEDMYKVLISSYVYLPQHLKACFLHMGVFPPKCEIPASKLIKLWNAEGFLEPNWKQDFEDFGRKCLEDLDSKSDLVLVRQQRSNISGIKTCSLHPVYWYLCNIEAVKEKFLHVVNSSPQGIERERRLCIHNNVLFGIEEVRDSMECNISMARSLLCTGPHHQYPLPRICFGSRLLRVVDTLTIRFYNFPLEVVELVHLRFLALTYSGNIPSSISKLGDLEYLIVHRHLSIISSEARPHLPVEIWNMRKLRCLQVMGSNLIIPNDNDNGGALLSNLLTLSYMSADSCSAEILKRTPNVKKLGIQIELAPGVAGNHPLHCFDSLAGHLRQLESLKCVVLNPNPRSRVVAFPVCNFPSTIKKLSLSGLGYPWEHMRSIARLPNLQVLKLLCYAFQGPVWLIKEFQKLRFLLIEDTDLECLKFLSYLRSLRHVIIRHCYKLKEISDDFSLEYPIKFELVDCPSALASVKETQEKFSENKFFHLSVQSSWDEKKHKS